MAIKVVINEQHSLFPQQEELLKSRFGEGWEYLLVPAAGWTKKEIMEVTEGELGEGNTLVFASPVPLMVQGFCSRGGQSWTFHNDRREKKELPGGKVIFTVAQEGWELL